MAGTLLTNLASSLAVAAGLLALVDLICRYAGGLTVNARSRTAPGAAHRPGQAARRPAGVPGNTSRWTSYLDFLSSIASASKGAPQVQVKTPFQLSPTAQRLKDCTICTETKRPREFHVATARCTHDLDVCTRCLRSYLQVEVVEKGRAGGQLICPSPNCLASFDDLDLRALFQPGDPVIACHEKRLVERALESDPSFRWCPENGCGNGQLIDDAGGSTFWSCAKCGARVCTNHRVIFHDGMTCAEYDAAATERPGNGSQWRRRARAFLGLASTAPPLIAQDADAERRRAAARAREDAAGRAAMAKLGVKRCPKCAQGLQKTDGCDHFTCGTAMGCKAQFCWLCMADWGPIVRHGNKHHKRNCRWYA